MDPTAPALGAGGAAGDPGGPSGPGRRNPAAPPHVRSLRAWPGHLAVRQPEGPHEAAHYALLGMNAVAGRTKRIQGVMNNTLRRVASKRTVRDTDTLSSPEKVDTTKLQKRAPGRGPLTGLFDLPARPAVEPEYVPPAPALAPHPALAPAPDLASIQGMMAFAEQQRRRKFDNQRQQLSVPGLPPLAPAPRPVGTGITSIADVPSPSRPHQVPREAREETAGYPGDEWFARITRIQRKLPRTSLTSTNLSIVRLVFG
ncbi:hypothetical protein B0T16DRAFT_9245 [Cercophora newfieldiana]|uniref:Uncharacterized protein n=1 Tax=Cercophora newfieldiana TaxID=92897 RepID=A0AA39YMK6_9PEZI|nr:hypothetical protein B0T16DRAFT_9245 [Cercophora newfieldiana]